MQDISIGKLLIYGANGYTGQLICEEAALKGLNPVLAGRNADAIKSLAQKYGWEYLVFTLDTVEEIVKHLDGVTVVLHVAGPFRFTAHNMLAACLQHGAHYLDITGEIEVFQKAWGLHEKALQKNIMLMPGTGFDVVPTDALALQLKENLPDAISLELAFVTLGGQISHGTAMSISEKLGEGGAARVDGELKPEPIARKSKTLQIDDKQFFVMSIPWGDIFTAWHTTGIPNIRAYTGSTSLAFWVLKLQFLFNPILRRRWFKRWLQKRINSRPPGPTAEKRAKAISYLWGEATNALGKKAIAWLSCPEGYTLTAYTSVFICQQVLAGNWKAGYQTPAGCYGSRFIHLLPGVSVTTLS